MKVYPLSLNGKDPREIYNEPDNESQPRNQEPELPLKQVRKEAFEFCRIHIIGSLSAALLIVCVLGFWGYIFKNRVVLRFQIRPLQK